ncbi:alpha/beta fold hydrolase [Sporosarcina sp. ANT_H38]|uniref:alpha/beta fold hydrolase n=1 Tax=Sporosarcina sp. ANT_H38 TaxID=2597358 RepID=UPI0011F0AED1|nr:alpha/beta fold hydrolase [Sporosarcina sp. ANT_H38]KAA0955835.1 alpha/beta fold hydrolase [Sporosarcina sp. ANT_H38]
METGIVEIGNLTLESGVILRDVQLAYERKGSLDRPVVLVCHALTGNHTTVGTDESPGWWSGLIGPGKTIDTNQNCVISINALGGSDGSTGPLTVNPDTGEAYRNLFPEVTIRDMVHAERKALAILGVNRIRAIIGGAFGGMRALEWGILYPDDMDILYPMAAKSQSNKIGNSSYTKKNNDNEMESFYPLIRAMKSHNIGRGRGGVELASRRITAKVVALAFTNDLMYSTEEIRAFVHLIPNSIYCLVNTKHGHDSFLTEFEKWGLVVKQSMEVAKWRQSKSLYLVSAL